MQPTPPIPTDDEIDAILMPHKGREGPLLPMLHGLQAEYGHIPAPAISRIAHIMNMTRAEVHGVVSFYHDFREKPAGRHVVKICCAEACQSVGGDVMVEETLAKLGLDWHATTPNGALTVEPVYCLGLCACGPAAMVDGKVVGRLDAPRLERILTEAGA
ncbi:formate dehydrogenase subunit gamma [Sedimentitalea nanhaiensis]|uniref:Formate dehydrogenase gamma subunit n=1 Tax=Sedimentitalea nanhaiensis TaxID=999627 RepID=A0A1I7E4F4_9RHOB|nr:formate dehydrogenase subunit gamma [Sedimentitalea nanhaiensis]SFU18804.1 formate dehydrogenase gamma subunit [Sedimentitalea nanhaiensis]